MSEGQQSVWTIDQLKAVDTPTLANAIETLHLRPNTEGFAPVELRCLFPELGRLCGYAVTAQVESMTPASPKEEKAFIDLFQAVSESPKPAIVAFQEIGGHADFATHCGEVMATFFARFGAAGLITDCAVRDLEQMRALRFQCFARGAVGSHSNFRVARIGVPVQVLGLAIRSGDLLHGDENGLIEIPRESLARLPQAVDSVRAREKVLMERALSPGFTPQQLRGRFFE